MGFGNTRQNQKGYKSPAKKRNEAATAAEPPEIAGARPATFVESAEFETLLGPLAEPFMKRRGDLNVRGVRLRSEWLELAARVTRHNEEVAFLRHQMDEAIKRVRSVDLSEVLAMKHYDGMLRKLLERVDRNGAPWSTFQSGATDADIAENIRDGSEGYDGVIDGWALVTGRLLMGVSPEDPAGQVVVLGKDLIADVRRLLSIPLPQKQQKPAAKKKGEPRAAGNTKPLSGRIWAKDHGVTAAQIEAAYCADKLAHTGPVPKKPVGVKAFKMDGRLWINTGGFWPAANSGKPREANVVPLYPAAEFKSKFGAKYEKTISGYTGHPIKVGKAEYFVGPRGEEVTLLYPIKDEAKGEEGGEAVAPLAPPPPAAKAKKTQSEGYVDLILGRSDDEAEGRAGSPEEVREEREAQAAGKPGQPFSEWKRAVQKGLKRRDFDPAVVKEEAPWTVWHRQGMKASDAAEAWTKGNGAAGEAAAEDGGEKERADIISRSWGPVLLDEVAREAGITFHGVSKLAQENVDTLGQLDEFLSGDVGKLDDCLGRKTAGTLLAAIVTWFEKRDYTTRPGFLPGGDETPPPAGSLPDARVIEIRPERPLDADTEYDAAYLGLSDGEVAAACDHHDFGAQGVPVIAAVLRDGDEGFLVREGDEEGTYVLRRLLNVWNGKKPKAGSKDPLLGRSVIWSKRRAYVGPVSDFTIRDAAPHKAADDTPNVEEALRSDPFDLATDRPRYAKRPVEDLFTDLPAHEANGASSILRSFNIQTIGELEDHVPLLEWRRGSAGLKHVLAGVPQDRCDQIILSLRWYFENKMHLKPSVTIARQEESAPANDDQDDAATPPPATPRGVETDHGHSRDELLAAYAFDDVAAGRGVRFLVTPADPGDRSYVVCGHSDLDGGRATRFTLHPILDPADWDGPPLETYAERKKKGPKGRPPAWEGLLVKDSGGNDLVLGRLDERRTFETPGPKAGKDAAAAAKGEDRDEDEGGEGGQD